MEHDPTQAGTPATVAGRAAGSAGDGPEALVGRVLAGRYRLEAVLGAGGMGAVYAAHDEALGRAVAVKVIKAQLAGDARLVQRFHREARAAAALAHPALVTVHDTGTDGGVPFLVMEKLNGESLGARIKRAALPAEQVIAIVGRVLDGLAAAHQAGIVHRDVKPDNVFLCAPDDAPKILDFGIAAARLPPDGAERLTDPGAGVGTPLYVAPEQLSGAAPDPRADVYSVGALLYEALSGRALFEARTLPELYAKKLHGAPRPLLEVAPTLPRALAEVVEQAIARDPEARFASATALKSALTGALGEISAPVPPTFHRLDAPGPAAEPSRPGQVTPPGQAAGTPTPGFTPSTPLLGEVEPAEPARRRANASLVILGLGLAIAAALALYRWPQSPVRRPQLGLRQLDAFEKASGSKRIVLQDAEGWRAAAEDLERSLADGAEARAPVRWRAGLELCRGEHRFLVHQLDDAQAAFQKAIALDGEWAAPHVGLASVEFERGRLDAALAEARKAEALAPGWWLPVARSAGFLANSGRHVEALQGFRRALQLAPEEPSLLDSMALELHHERMDDEASELARRALARDPDLAHPHVILAERALEANHGDEALREATLAVTASPALASAQLARADALALLGRASEATAAYARVLELAHGSESGLPSGRLPLVEAAVKAQTLPPPRVPLEARALPAGAAPAEAQRSLPPPTRSAPKPARSRPKPEGGMLDL